MTQALSMPNGPWKKLIEGKWESHRFELLENPDKLTALVLFDEEKAKLKGLVVVMHKYFTARGAAEKLVDKISASMISKNEGDFKANYIVLSTSPQYAKPAELAKTAHAALDELESKSEELNEESNACKVETTELKMADPEHAKRLFSDISVILTAGKQPAASASAPTVRMREGATWLLGKQPGEEEATELPEVFMNTILIGKESECETAARVLIENCVLSGLTAIVFDEANAFADMGTPNSKFPAKDYPNLEPIGMPTKTPAPGTLHICLTHLNDKLIMELLELPKVDKFHGSDAFQLICDVAKTKKPESLEELRTELMKNRDPSQQFNAYRAARIIKLMERLFYGMFGKDTELSTLISPYSRTMGGVTRISLAELRPAVRKALVYSTLKTLNIRLAGSTQMKAVCFLRGENAPEEQETETQKAITQELIRCQDAGIGKCLSAENDVDIASPIVQSATIKLEFISAKEVAVKKHGSRPYRVVLRPPLSAQE